MNSEGAKSDRGLQHLGVNGSRVRIDVEGRPRTKGSLVPVHTKIAPGRCRVSLRESGEYSVAWKKEMIKAIKRQCAVTRYAEPVVIDCFFRFDRLCVPDVAMDWPTREGGTYGHGDEDKLRRNALDALTQSGLILDDSLSIGGHTWKRWTRAEANEVCGVIIKVRPADPIADMECILRAEQRP